MNTRKTIALFVFIFWIFDNVCEAVCIFFLKKGNSKRIVLTLYICISMNIFGFSMNQYDL